MKAKLLIFLLFLQFDGAVAQPIHWITSEVQFNLFDGSRKVSGINSNNEFSTTHFLWFKNIGSYLGDLRAKDSLNPVSVYYHSVPASYPNDRSNDSTGFVMYVVKTYQEYVEPQWGANRFWVENYSIMAIEFPNIFENYFVDSLVFSPGYFKANIKSDSDNPLLEETQRPFKSVELIEKYVSGIADKIFRCMHYTQRSYRSYIVATQSIPEKLHFLEKALDLKAYDLIHEYKNKCVTDSTFNSTDFFCQNVFQNYYYLDTEDQLQNKINNLLDSLYTYAVNTGDYYFKKWKKLAELQLKGDYNFGSWKEVTEPKLKKKALEAYEYALTLKPKEEYLKTQIEKLK